MAERSVVITLANQTSQNLFLSAQNLLHGIWAVQPPQNIGPNSSATFEADSNGFATGVEGSATYSFQSASSQLVNLVFDNPFVGASSYTGSAPAGYHLDPFTSGGNNAAVIYTLTGS